MGVQQPPGLLGDRGEHLLRRSRPRHQRRYPPQRRLLLGRSGKSGAALGVGDRGRDQLGEPGQPRLGIRRQQLLAGQRHDQGAPQPALDLIGTPTAARRPQSRVATSPSTPDTAA